jgi:hypothetical protein
MMTALHIPTPPEDLPRSVGDALQSSGFADSYFLQKHVNRNRMPFAQVEFSARGYFILLDKQSWQSWRRKSQIMNALEQATGHPPLLHPTLSGRDASSSINARNAG